MVHENEAPCGVDAAEPEEPPVLPTTDPCKKFDEKMEPVEPRGLGVQCTQPCEASCGTIDFVTEVDLPYGKDITIDQEPACRFFRRRPRVHGVLTWSTVPGVFLQSDTDAPARLSAVTRALTRIASLTSGSGSESLSCS